MRKSLVSMAVVLVFAGVCNAAVTFSYVPSISPSGFDSYVISLATDSGEIVGLDIDFQGNFNQVTVGGNDTIFQDYNFAMSNPLDDTQFLFNSADVINGTPAFESDTQLYGNFAFAAGSPFIGSELDIARLVIPQNDGGSVTGTVAVKALDGSISVQNIVQPLDVFPDAVLNDTYQLGPGESVVLSALGSHGIGGVESYSWDLDGDGTYDIDAGTSALLELSFDDLLGYGLRANNIYDITLQVLDRQGDTDTAQTTLEMVPEPASIALVGLGGLAVIKRRRAA